MDLDWDRLVEFMAPAYAAQATKAECEALMERIKQEDPGWESDNLVMACTVPAERETDISYCRCSSCKKLPYTSLPREHFCCRDVLFGETKWAGNIRELMEREKLDCLTQFRTFRKICLDKEVLISHLRFAGLKMKKIVKTSDINNSDLRHAASICFTNMVHGYVRTSKKYPEMPNCIRNAIIAAFPETNNVYCQYDPSGYENCYLLV